MPTVSQKIPLPFFSFYQYNFLWLIQGWKRKVFKKALSDAVKLHCCYKLKVVSGALQDFVVKKYTKQEAYEMQ